MLLCEEASLGSGDADGSGIGITNDVSNPGVQISHVHRPCSTFLHAFVTLLQRAVLLLVVLLVAASSCGPRLHGSPRAEMRC